MEKVAIKKRKFILIRVNTLLVM